MTHTGILTRVEIESMGPPVLEELREADVPASFLCDLALKHVAQMPEPTTRGISEELRLPRALVEEMLVRAGREERAVEHLEAARRLQPDSQNVLRQLAEVYERTGRGDKAGEARQTLAAIDARQSAAAAEER